MKLCRIFSTVSALCLITGAIRSESTPNLQSEWGYIDAGGTTHVTRAVPVPGTVSAEAQAKLSKQSPSILLSKATIAEQRALMDARQARDAAACLRIYPATVSAASMAGVPVRIVTPAAAEAEKDDRVLINLHGGAFRVDAGSLLESIPIASLSRTKVIAVLYRLAPEHPFPDAVDDAVAVYRELLKTCRPDRICIYGTSAGAILTVETAVRLKQLGLPLPAALGVFSGHGDFSLRGDSESLFGLQGLAGPLFAPGLKGQLPDYVGEADPKNPVLSPMYADLHGMPPTLFLTSTRDLLLSGTARLHRAFLGAGVQAHLVVFEALPHAFWLDPSLPESRDANEQIARFLDAHLRSR